MFFKQSFTGASPGAFLTCMDTVERSVGLAHMLGSLAAGLEAPVANLTIVLSFLLRMTTDEMHSPRIVGREYLWTSRARVSESFLVNSNSVRHSCGSSFQNLPALSTREAPDFVRLHVRPKPSFGHESLAAKVANVVLVMEVHVFVQAVEVDEVFEANLAREIVLIVQSKGAYAVTEIGVETLIMIVYEMLLQNFYAGNVYTTNSTS